MNGIDDKTKLIKTDLRQYKPQDIWNADETGPFFCMPPDRTISSQPMLGCKEERSVTLLVPTNADWSQKMPLMTIGAAH